MPAGCDGVLGMVNVNGKPRQVTDPLPPLYALFTVQLLYPDEVEFTSVVFSVKVELPVSKFSLKSTVCPFTKVEMSIKESSKFFFMR